MDKILVGAVMVGIVALLWPASSPRSVIGLLVACSLFGAALAIINWRVESTFD